MAAESRESHPPEKEPEKEPWTRTIDQQNIPAHKEHEKRQTTIEKEEGHRATMTNNTNQLSRAAENSQDSSASDSEIEPVPRPATHQQPAAPPQQQRRTNKSKSGAPALKLDMDLDVEVELKAKIRGDITLSILGG